MVFFLTARFKKIIKKFTEIAKERWIKGINNTSNYVGMPFEMLLNKQPDSMYFPDYNGIEINCSQRFNFKNQYM